MVVIDRLSGISIETIHSTFVKAFSDYDEPIKLSVHQLKYMIERRGVNLDLSFGAFFNDELIGFTLNGIGDWNGKLTAYDSGTAGYDIETYDGWPNPFNDDGVELAI